MTTNVIEARDLRKQFASRGGPVEAVRGVSFDVAPRRDLRLPRPERRRQDDDAADADDAAADRLGHRDGRRLRRRAASPSEVRARIGYVSQLGGADDLATGRENLVLQGRLYGARQGSTSPRRVEELLDAARPRELRRPHASRPTRAASAGASTSRSGSCTSPQVLFLDEPTTGLDPQNRANLWEHIRALRERGHDRLPHDALPRGGGRALRPRDDHRPRRDRRRGQPARAQARGRRRLGRAARRRRRRGRARAQRCSSGAPFVERSRPVEDGAAALLRRRRRDRAARAAAAARRRAHRRCARSACPSRRSTTSSSPRPAARCATPDTGAGRWHADEARCATSDCCFRRYTLQFLRNPVWLFVGFIDAAALPRPVHAAAEGRRPSLSSGAGARRLPARHPRAARVLERRRAPGFGTIFELQVGRRSSASA